LYFPFGVASLSLSCSFDIDLLDGDFRFSSNVEMRHSFSGGSTHNESPDDGTQGLFAGMHIEEKQRLHSE
jgi:hypothetical protein